MGAKLPTSEARRGERVQPNCSNIAGNPLVTMNPVWDKVYVANTDAAYEILKWRDDDGTVVMLGDFLEPFSCLHGKDPNILYTSSTARICEYGIPTGRGNISDVADTLEEFVQNQSKKWVVVSSRDGGTYVTMVLIYWMVCYHNKSQQEAFDLLQKQRQEAADHFYKGNAKWVNYPVQFGVDTAQCVGLLQKELDFYVCHYEDVQDAMCDLLTKVESMCSPNE
eukprot:COSAG05_NODE_464_length_9544_cov_2.541345_5_plen_223_part_00